MSHDGPDGQWLLWRLLGNYELLHRVAMGEMAVLLTIGLIDWLDRFVVDWLVDYQIAMGLHFFHKNFFLTEVKIRSASSKTRQF